MTVTIQDVDDVDNDDDDEDDDDDEEEEEKKKGETVGGGGGGGRKGQFQKSTKNEACSSRFIDLGHEMQSKRGTQLYFAFKTQ